MPHHKHIIILLQLGGPSSLDEVESFVYSLLKDPYVIRLPLLLKPLQSLLAKRIVTKRLNKSKQLYADIGGKSPLIEITNRQASKLENLINMPCYVLMRHSKPNNHELLNELENITFDNVIILPLYPQYSTTTTESGFKQVEQLFAKHYPYKTIQYIRSYPDHELYIQAWVTLIQQKLSQLQKYKKYTQGQLDNIILNFSAHGIPESYIEKYNDTYLDELNLTVNAVMQSFPNNTGKLTFQSKVGKQKWLEPSTEDYLESLVPKSEVLIIPVSFVSEHLETIQEIGIQFRDICIQQNITMHRIPTINTEPNYINCLADLVNQNLQ